MIAFLWSAIEIGLLILAALIVWILVLSAGIATYQHTRREWVRWRGVRHP